MRMNKESRNLLPADPQANAGDYIPSKQIPLCWLFRQFPHFPTLKISGFPFLPSQGGTQRRANKTTKQKNIRFVVIS